MILLHIRQPLQSDPDFDVGGYLTLERADGRPVWRQRLKCIQREVYDHMVSYTMQPVKDIE